MKVRIVTAIAALVLATAASAPASAFGWGVHDHPRYERCTASSASEGNADQQTRPVKQYGQTSGGNLC